VTLVQSWEGAVSRHEFSHPVYANDSYTFSWAFQKASLSDFDVLSNLLESDVARIFSINVTNTIGKKNLIFCSNNLYMEIRWWRKCVSAVPRGDGGLGLHSVSGRTLRRAQHNSVQPVSQRHDRLGPACVRQGVLSALRPRTHQHRRRLVHHQLHNSRRPCF
jgi:hypothetical protein